LSAAAARGCHREAKDRVRAQPRLSLGAVEHDHRLVQSPLVAGVVTSDGVCDLPVDVRDSVRDRLAAKRPFAIAQLERLAGAC
jgi:hypothetical protein